MAVLIKQVRGRSGFFKPGDEIVSLSSHPVRDQLDLMFRVEARARSRVTIRRNGSTLSRTLTRTVFENARLVLEEMRFTRCASRCVFCFMDQMPRGLRRSLYEKDDDYRLSFLYGNFITLNDVRDSDLRRIVEQRLSPLYVSVHARNARVRERIFGRPMRRDIVRDMERLARAGITMHAQIVLVPEVNDGAVLRGTVRWLFSLYPACRSVAVVPVGLTAHRGGLPPLRPGTPDEFRDLVDWAAAARERYRSLTGGESFIHLADEIYLGARRPLPPAEDYDDFPQLANGVGMCRQFLEALELDAARLARNARTKAAPTVATGTLAAEFLRRYAAPMLRRRLGGWPIRIMPVRNRLFGASVTVAGLLAGNDIVRAARRLGTIDGCLVIPGDAVNHDGLLIDDMRPSDIERLLGVPVVVAESTFLEPQVLRRCRERRT